MIMRQIKIVKRRPVRPAGSEIDTQTPSGKPLPY